jgi:hypothetical protein
MISAAIFIKEVSAGERVCRGWLQLNEKSESPLANVFIGHWPGYAGIS